MLCCSKAFSMYDLPTLHSIFFFIRIEWVLSCPFQQAFIGPLMSIKSLKPTDSGWTLNTQRKKPHSNIAVAQGQVWCLLELKREDTGAQEDKSKIEGGNKEFSCLDYSTHVIAASCVQLNYWPLIMRIASPTFLPCRGHFLVNVSHPRATFIGP